MLSAPDTVIVSDRKRISNRLIVACVLLVGVPSFLVGWYLFQQYNDRQIEQILEAENLKIMVAAESVPFVFTVVPNALEQVTIPAPLDSRESDTLAYEQLKNSTVEAAFPPAEDVIFNQTFMAMSYGEFLNTIENPEDIFQIMDELHFLTIHFNTLYTRPFLKDRIEGVVEQAPLDALSANEDVRSVYPSIRAVDAYAGVEIMSMFDPENRQSYMLEAQALVDRGIGYGLYGKSDADAALSLVSQYFELYYANQPNNL